MTGTLPDTDLLAGVALSPGARLGRYELIAPIGRGGMAVVWAARLVGSHGFSKLVAVKTMLPALGADPRFAKMFLDEATVSSSIEHANVCEVLDLGDCDGHLYLVMEWVHGDTLAALESEHAGPLPAGVAGRIGVDVARGLHAAHEATDSTGARLGVVHRDVSPQNVLVGLDGRSKIADFGVAKRDGGPATEAGYVKGKVRYMAPEQVYSEKVDRRTDIFALGVVLYEATTGRHPFAGATDVATLSNIAGPEEAAPPGTLVIGYPTVLAAVVMRALAKDPPARFATAAELADALEAALPEPARHEDVAAWIQQACGARIAARQNLIRTTRSDPSSSDPGGRTSSPSAARTERPRASFGKVGATLLLVGVLTAAIVAGLASHAPTTRRAAAEPPERAPARPTATVDDRPELAPAPSAGTSAPARSSPPAPATSPDHRARTAAPSARASAGPVAAPASPASTPKPDVLETRE